MIIELKKFGTTLTSRQLGKEAVLGFLPTLETLSANEEVIIDFSGVNTFSPSWGDEFLTHLHKLYADRLFLMETDNPSINATIKILEQTNNMKFQKK